MKAKHFDLVQKKCYHKQFVSIYAQKFWDEAKQFGMVFLLSEREQNVLIWSAYYRNESKTILFGPKIIQGGSDKSGNLVFLK
jgi:hypothetical protein